MRRRNRLAAYEEETSPHLIEQVRGVARPLEDERSLDPLLERIGNARYVLLGEASHGTADYYMWRARISQRLIREKGFSFLAVEGDWPDCYRINQYIKHAPDAGSNAHEVLNGFRRWPTWMWANQEVEYLAEWLREHNHGLSEERQVGFFGLDVYSLWESLYEVMGYLQRVDPSAVEAARKAYHCFEPYGEDVQEYARATMFVPNRCEDEVVHLLAEVRHKAAEYKGMGREAYFVAEQNALVLQNAEHYYRIMVHGGPESWNVRDRHMTQTLERLMMHHGPDAKGIVWEHNTHVGDARFTDMAEDGMVNIGQLTRERHERDGVVLVGFATHRGGVIAGREWEAPMERMPVPNARPGSWDDLLHQAGAEDKLLLFDDAGRTEEMLQVRGQRAIGVVYHPEYEHLGNYVPTVLPRRYDALLYLDQTEALHPLHLAPHEEEVPETYPSGL